METDVTTVDVMTVEEVRKRLRLSRNGIYEAIKRNEVPHLRIGRRIVIPRSAYERMLNGESAHAA